jgi:hypothetical protein
MEKVKRSKLLTTESICIDCGNNFKVTIEEMSRFKDKRIPLPTRCKSCRRSKLIELKLKRMTKVLFKILSVVAPKTYEHKLQKKQGEGVEVKKES